MLPNDFGCSKLVWRFYELIAIVMVIFSLPSALWFLCGCGLVALDLSGRQTQTSGLAQIIRKLEATKRDCTQREHW